MALRHRAFCLGDPTGQAGRGAFYSRCVALVSGAAGAAYQARRRDSPVDPRHPDWTTTVRPMVRSQLDRLPRTQFRARRATALRASHVEERRVLPRAALGLRLARPELPLGALFQGSFDGLMENLIATSLLRASEDFANEGVVGIARTRHDLGVKLIPQYLETLV